jgi:hypothetical protein
VVRYGDDVLMEAQEFAVIANRLEKTLCDIQGMGLPTMLWSQGDMEELHRLLASATSDAGRLVEEKWH